MSSKAPVLLVLGDSLSFYGPKGGCPADEPRIWPNLVAAELGWETELVARVGWTARDAYWAAVNDPRVWAAVPRARAVVLAVSGMDSLPSPLPTAMREQMRYIRPTALRQQVRSAYQWMQPRLAPVGWPVALPPSVSVSYLERIRVALNHLRPDLPIIATTPPTHHSEYYGYAHPRRANQHAAVEQWAAEHDVPVLDLYDLTHEHVRAGSGNPDGIHWGWEAHAAVADSLRQTLRSIGTTS